MSRSSIREYAVLYVGKGGSSNATVGGGNVVLNAGQHPLDGIEHTHLDSYVKSIEGGDDTIKDHGSLGATEAFDPTDGNVHVGTLDADCTVTLDPPAEAGGATLVGWFTQSGGPWTLDFAASGGGSFVWDGTTPTIPSTGTFRVILERIPGTSNDWVANLVGGSGGPDLSAIDFLVGTASGLLSGEIAVGTAPGGELGGTWASPTVDATHAGSTHIALSSATPLVESGAGSAGSGTAASKDDHVHPAAASSGSNGPSHVHVAYETHTADGSTTTFTLDQVYDAGSVMAWNRTAGTLLGVTEVAPDQATISAAGTAADLIDFFYAASII